METLPIFLLIMLMLVLINFLLLLLYIKERALNRETTERLIKVVEGLALLQSLML